MSRLLRDEITWLFSDAQGVSRTSETCMLADVLQKVPRLAACFSSGSLAALLACNRELRSLVRHSTQKVIVTRLTDINLLRKHDWSKLRMVILDLHSSFRCNLLGLPDRMPAKLGFAPQNDKLRALVHSARLGVELHTPGSANLCVADIIELALPAICVYLGQIIASHFQAFMVSIMPRASYWTSENWARLRNCMDELIDIFQNDVFFAAMLSNFRSDSHILQSQLDVKQIMSLNPNAAQLHPHPNVRTDSGKQAARFQPSHREQRSIQLVCYDFLPMPLMQVGKAFVLFQAASVHLSHGSGPNRYIWLSAIHCE